MSLTADNSSSYFSFWISTYISCGNPVMCFLYVFKSWENDKAVFGMGVKISVKISWITHKSNL